MNKNEVLIELDKLKLLKDKHLNLGSNMIKAYGGSIYPVDLLAFATLNRSIKNLTGFITLIENANIICAGSLLRLQIDSCIRYFASFIVDDPHGFSVKVLEGQQINKLLDKDGERMTDSYLVKKMALFAPWIENVYKETCGYIHLSNKHFLNSIKPLENNSIEIHISEKDQYISKELYIEAIKAFESTTILLFDFIMGWIRTKQNPDIVKIIRDSFVLEFGREPSVFDNIKINTIDC